MYVYTPHFAKHTPYFAANNQKFTIVFCRVSSPVASYDFLPKFDLLQIIKGLWFHRISSASASYDSIRILLQIIKRLWLYFVWYNLLLHHTIIFCIWHFAFCILYFASYNCILSGIISCCIIRFDPNLIWQIVTRLQKPNLRTFAKWKEIFDKKKRRVYSRILETSFQGLS